ncbi:MAG: hypothetical protein GY946_31215 [bacterium]|nr:hypothetical protein [bacterium]
MGANLLPLLGVLFWGWSTRHILLLYWAESGVVGFYTIARMLRVGGLRALGTAAFFSVHYGGFMAAHLVVLLFILGSSPFGGMGTLTPPPWDDASPGVLMGPDAHLMLWALLVSHGVSFVQNFLGREEWRRTTAMQEMFAPYPRIMLMHVAIIFGFGLALLTGSASAVLAVLIFFKTAVDLVSHWREHQRRAAPQPAAAGDGRSADGP